MFQFVIVVDDENGDVEGNLIMAATLTSPKDIAFLIKNGSGIVSVGMKKEDLERLSLTLMSPEMEDEDSSAPTFTITVVTRLAGTYRILKMVSLLLSSGKFLGDRMQNPEHQLEYQLQTGR